MPSSMRRVTFAQLRKNSCRANGRLEVEPGVRISQIVRPSNLSVAMFLADDFRCCRLC